MAAYTSFSRSSTGSHGAASASATAVVDLRRDRALELVEVAVLEQAALPQHGREEVDRIALAPVLDLLLRPVEIGVGHRVGAEAVGAELHQARALAAAHRLDPALRGVAHGEDVHPVDALRGHAVALRPEGQVELRLRALDGRAHGVEVVLAEEEHRAAARARRG